MINLSIMIIFFIFYYLVNVRSIDSSAENSESDLIKSVKPLSVKLL